MHNDLRGIGQHARLLRKAEELARMTGVYPQARRLFNHGVPINLALAILTKKGIR